LMFSYEENCKPPIQFAKKTLILNPRGTFRNFSHPHIHPCGAKQAASMLEYLQWLVTIVNSVVLLQTGVELSDIFLTACRFGILFYLCSNSGWYVSYSLIALFPDSPASFSCLAIKDKEESRVDVIVRR